MKIKSIIAGLALTVGSLFFAIEPAQAETCSTGTYNVAGINTFGGLPCSDPGTEINVTVRGLHDYGVSGGPTAYCSFIYVRKNLGTASKPNWSASTDTICDARPTPPPAPVVTPSPTPTPSASPSSSSNSTNSNNSTECSALNPCMVYAEVDNAGSVANVIVCQPSVCGTDGVFNGTVNGNKLVAQYAANPETNDTTGVGGQRTNSIENKLVTVSEDNVFTVSQNGVIVERFVAPEIKRTETSTVTSSIFVSFSDSTTVTTNSTTGEDTVIVENSAIANISASKTTAVSNSSSTESESLVIQGRKTEQEVVEIVSQGSFNILKSKIASLTRLLGMGGWFL